MPLSSEQKLELDLFEKELELQNPTDTLQFAANYFNKRLELQRGFVRDQAKLALSKGIILFPPTAKSDSTAASNAALKSSNSSTVGPMENVESPVPSTVTATTAVAPVAPAPASIATQGSVPAVINETGGPTEVLGAVVFKSPFDNRRPDPSLGPEPELGPDTVPTPVTSGVPSSTVAADHNNNNSESVTPSSDYPSASNTFFKSGFSLSGDSTITSPTGKRKSPAFQSSPPSAPSNEPQKFPRTKPSNAASITGSSSSSTSSFPKPKSYTPLPLRFNAERRTSVSGESINPDKFDDWTPEHYHEKTAEQMKRLEKSIGKNFLFNNLDIDNKRLVINCLEEKKVPQNTVIIKQGDEGDYFYIVESGTVEFYVNSECVSASGPGSSFGELALMYNSPRAATAVAQTDCVLWSLDRLTFRKVLLGSSFKKRIMYDDLLKSVPVLKTLTTYDRAKLSDALETRFFEPGQVIIKEGEVGENFYLIEYGECEVTKEGEGVVNRLKGGDYFGEIALINDLPRQATVTAVKATKVAFLGKSGFQRLLGPVVDVLKLNDPRKIH